MRTDADDLARVRDPAIELLLSHPATLTDEWCEPRPRGGSSPGIMALGRLRREDQGVDGWRRLVVRIRQGLRTWFRTPPARHGEVMYAARGQLPRVVLRPRVRRADRPHDAPSRARTSTGRAIAEFAVVFGLIWLAWFNGTFWHELHGREDGRSRNYIFLQMGLLALLAVFAGDATGERRRRVRHHLQRPVRVADVAVVGRCIASTPTCVPADDAPLPRRHDRHRGRDARRALRRRRAARRLWALVVVGWVVGGLVLVATDHTEGFGEGVTASLVERMGLFTIIVLGEVVVGVVGGISDAEHRDVRRRSPPA